MKWSPTLTSKDFPEDFDDWTLEDKIKLFKDQVLGWQLRIADGIINEHGGENPHAGFAILSILLNYFEMIGKYIKGYPGTRQSAAHFKIGLVNVFPELIGKKRVCKILYEDARCGMYHEALIGKRIVLTRDYNTPIFVLDENVPIVAIDPHTLATRLIEHFEGYVSTLQASAPESQIVKDFTKRFNFLKRGKVDLQKNL